MNAIGTTAPDSDPAIQRLLVESRARTVGRWRDRPSKQRMVESLAAGGFALVAVLMAVLIDSPRSLNAPLAAVLIGTYALATRVEFHTGSGWTDPSQLVLVPMLFLLPTPTVPLAVAIGSAVARAREYVAREVRADDIVFRLGDAWYSVWPALVLIAGSATEPDWSNWPVYVGALAAQFGIDSITTTVRVRPRVGVPIRTVLHELRSIYLVDTLLAPIGLLAAFAAAQQQWAFLLVLPLIGLIAIFARERDARIDNALALSSAYRGTAHLLGEVLSSTDEYTGTHSRSVVVLAHQVGQKLGLDEATLREIEFGALLHDVGKIAIPNEIIRKPGALSEEEWEVMRRHTIHGEDMLKRIGGVLEEVGVVVRTHHERWDGSGYPDGLRGEEIPIAARIIAACDAFNAMTTDRPYRPAMPIAKAISELDRCAGEQFDPNVVGALVGIVRSWERGEPDADVPQAAVHVAQLALEAVPSAP